jgi:phosphate-selective porin OprO/OprP
MGYDIDMARRLRLVFFLVLAAWLTTGLPAEAQDVPQLPVPLSVPTPTPTPIPEPPAEAPAEPADAEESDQPGERGEAQQQAEESGTDEAPEETPEREQETNPGDVAFTDYHAFDLDEIEPEPVKTKWANFVAGFRGIARYSLFDGRLKFRLGGRGQLDGTAGFNDEKFEEYHDPIEADFSIRRLEVYAVGRLNKFNFNLAFEFGPDWGFSDAWIEGAEGGLEVWGKYLGKLRVGWMNEPFSLERQTGAYNLGLMERSLPVQTIAPGSNIGAMVHDSGPKGRFTWAVGIFSIGHSNDNNASASLLSLTGRATFRPLYSIDGRNLIHFGLSLSSRSPSGGDVRYRSRPEARFVDYLVDTGPFEASHATLVGLEFAAVRGPLWITAEHIRSKVSAQLVDNPTFKGSYVKVGWFLTGESKQYRANSGVFARERPLTKYTGGNPFKKRNGGAWELVGRLSRVDLTDGLIEGGELTDISGALSWYINATTRVELNYIYASPKNQGAANIALLRVQYQPW